MTELPFRGRQAAGRAAQPQLVPVPVRTATAVTAEPPAPAREHHLGDRLAAFVDGELDHDARERVQAHLVSCPGCLVEAEAQRRVKDLLVRGPGPGPSGLLTSRLLAIAAEVDEPPDEGGPWPRGRDGRSATRRGFGSGALDAGSFGGSVLFGGGALGAERPLAGVDPRADGGGRGGAGRGRRFAFVAAGAFSVAAVALSSALTVGAGETTTDEPYGNVSPVAETSSVGGLLNGANAPLVQAALPDGARATPTATALPTDLRR